MNIPQHEVIDLIDEMNWILGRASVLTTAIQVVTEEGFGKDEIVTLANLAEEEIDHAHVVINKWYESIRTRDNRAQENGAAPAPQSVNHRPTVARADGQASRRRS